MESKRMFIPAFWNSPRGLQIRPLDGCSPFVVQTTWTHAVMSIWSPNVAIHLSYLLSVILIHGNVPHNFHVTTVIHILAISSLSVLQSRVQ